MLTFQGKALFKNNSAEAGGAILSTDTEIFISKDSGVYVTNNNATQAGGGMDGLILKYPVADPGGGGGGGGVQGFPYMEPPFLPISLVEVYHCSLRNFKV